MPRPQLLLVTPSNALEPAKRASLLDDRAALVWALRQRDEYAAALFFREFEDVVERTIGRIIGFGDDLPDATQEAFLRAMRSLERLRDPQSLVDWLLQIAVCTAKDVLRRRRRRRWLHLLDSSEAEEPVAPSSDESSREAVLATYRVLDRMSPDERAVFVLRFVEGMDIDSLANAHDCSRSTMKRRLSRATARFQALARREQALASWLEQASPTTDTEEAP